MDTTVIFGRGAVEDTCNLVAHAIQHLCEALAEIAGQRAATWSEGRGLGRCFAPSIKGTAEIDWDDRARGKRS